MKKIVDLFKDHPRTYSLEFFPPKTEDGYKKLLETIAQLAKLNPSFMTCTYGAGGGSRDKTLDIVEHIQKTHNIVSMAHLTCVISTKDQLKSVIDEIKKRGIKNILALRGDPPKDQPDWKPGTDNFAYSSELCAFIRKNYGDHFGIAVAGFPEGHLLCPDRTKDAQYLRMKIDNGADFVITQLFFNNQDYFNYVKRLRAIGVHARVVPGILPITDYDSLLRFASTCGATVTEEIHKIFAPIKEDKEKTLKTGIEFAIRQCQELLKGDAPGLHFYALNKVHPVEEIWKAVRV